MQILLWYFFILSVNKTLQHCKEDFANLNRIIFNILILLNIIFGTHIAFAALVENKNYSRWRVLNACLMEIFKHEV